MADKGKQPRAWRAWAVVWKSPYSTLNMDIRKYRDELFCKPATDEKPIRVTVTEGWPKAKRRKP